MLYANIDYENIFVLKNEINNPNLLWRVNFGDHAQLLAIDNIYNNMGVDSEDIVRIKMQDLKTYDGPNVILPINLMINGQNFFDDSGLKLSSKITPVFLGVEFVDFNFSKETIDYLKQYEPIGCRSETCYLKLKEFGVKSYLNGCMTITLPRRNSVIKGENVYLIDVPQKIDQYFPYERFENIKVETNGYFDKKNIIDSVILKKEKMENYIIKRYKAYCDNASLIITSRLHIASPCIAFGIPVIFLKDEIDNRLSWLDKYIPLYDQYEYNKIDWHPKSIDIESIKEIIIENAKLHINNGGEKYYDSTITDYYLSRNKHKYIESRKNNIIKEISNKWKKNKDYSYAMWGKTNIAEETYQYINKNFPKAKLIRFFDKNRAGEKFHNITIEKPEMIKDNSNYVTLITAISVCDIAVDFFKRNATAKDAYILLEKPIYCMDWFDPNTKGEKHEKN